MLSESQFHAELAGDRSAGLRDLHTVYQLPDPYRGHVATLGFLVERYHAEPRRRARATSSRGSHPALEHAGLQAPAPSSSRWNGIPIERAVERLTPSARPGRTRTPSLARGLEALTLRPLRNAPPPRRALGRSSSTAPRARGAREMRIPWRVVPARRTPPGARKTRLARSSAVLGIDAGNEATRQIKRCALRRRPGPGSADALALRRRPATTDRQSPSAAASATCASSASTSASARRFIEPLARPARRDARRTG